MKKFGVEIKWALIFTAISLLWMFFEKSMGWHDELIAKQLLYTNFFGIIAIILYVFALKDKRENYFDGVMGWKQGFISGCILSVIIAGISPLSQYISYTMISPLYFDHIITYQVENDFMESGKAENLFNLSSFIFQYAFYALSFGIVTAAIVAWFLKRGTSDQTEK